LKKFELWPAIDLIDGKIVRLKQGDFSKKTDFSAEFSVQNLPKIFKSFATGIHIIDLDGAKSGSSKNLDTINEIIQNSEIPVEVGGGIRNINDAEKLFEIGVSRIIFGTAAIENPEILMLALKNFGKEKIAIGVDFKNNKVATRGWQKISDISAENLLANLQDWNFENVIITDISTDGMLCGPPVLKFVNWQKKFSQLKIIASGGISKIEDLQELKKNKIAGAVFGKAFFEKKISTKDLENFSKL